MIQRIQSLYLLLTSLSSLLFLKGSILKFFSTPETILILNFSGLWQLTEGENLVLIRNQIVLPVIITAAILLPVIIIFFFKNRKLQLRLIMILIITGALLTALIVYLTVSISVTYDVHMRLVIRMFLPLIILLFSLLAYMGIKKDENLVRSYDRLR
jgi:hypothetical protein